MVDIPKVDIPSPALAVVGRHNSGKTTLIVKLIACLVARGYDVGSIKHHSHDGFEIDIPGKDSYRHREAGASETVISSPGLLARIKDTNGESECRDLVASMPNHDIVVVEGYRKSGLPTVEIMRGANEADAKVAAVFAHGAAQGWPLGTDFTQVMRNLRSADSSEERDALLASLDESAAAAAQREAAEAEAAGAEADNAAEPNYSDVSRKLILDNTVAIVTDIPEAVEAAGIYGIPAFGLDDVEGLADFVAKHFVRPKTTVVIQAGGESRRMGRSKATVPFAGRPLICRLVERLSPAADELVITTNEPQNLEFLHEMYPELGIRLVTDRHDRRGALPGLHTALSAATHQQVAVVACDMVFASAKLVVAESVVMNDRGADVVVPVNKHGFEPFHAMYRKDTCLPVIAAAVDRGEARAQAIFGDLNVFHFSQKMVLQVEPRGGCFVNCNTPQELKYLEDGFAE